MRNVAAVVLSLCSVGAVAQPAAPKLRALAAIVMDAETGRVLYSKNSKLRLHPASTTKIMTSLLLVERCGPEDVLTAPADIEKVRESSLHLKPDEQVTAEEMLYALMLRSANDGCHVVAEHIAGSEAEFAKLMNERAKQIGCEGTTFVNPHGLTHKDHLTTAHDLALMAREAMKDPVLAKVAGTQKHTIKRSLNQADTLLINRDKFLAEDPRAKGVKTGWTKAAGHCFVGYASDSGMSIVTAILKSDSWLEDQKAITNWAFDHFENRTFFKKGDVVWETDIKNAKENPVKLVAGSDLKSVSPKDDRYVTLSPELVGLEAPQKVGARAGLVALVVNGQTLEHVEVVLANDVEAKTTLLQSMTHPAALIGFMALGGGTYLMRRKSKQLADRQWR